MDQFISAMNKILKKKSTYVSLTKFRGHSMKYVIYVIVSAFMLSSAVPSFADHHESKQKKEKKDKKDK
jgi:hypothetical protein